VNVGAGARTALLGLIGMIGTIAGRQVDFVHQPPRSGDVRDSLASLERAERLLDYKPRISLEAGLRRTWTWVTDGSRTVARERAPAALRETP
jgi:nucleoside-diphosphate-sugar epimerase